VYIYVLVNSLVWIGEVLEMLLDTFGIITGVTSFSKGIYIFSIKGFFAIGGFGEAIAEIIGILTRSDGGSGLFFEGSFSRIRSVLVVKLFANNESRKGRA
jgi:hypothetical protein